MEHFGCDIYVLLRNFFVKMLKHILKGKKMIDIDVLNFDMPEMESISYLAKLEQWFTQAKKEGLLDIKIFPSCWLNGIAPQSAEDVAKELLEMLTSTNVSKIDLTKL